MPDQVLRHDAACRLCGGTAIATVFRLQPTPMEDQFVTAERMAVPQPVYPLELALCEDCGYVHLPHIVNPEESYPDYIYESGVTVGLRHHYDQYAREVAAEFGTPAGALLLDLGSNDGSMLASFKRLGMKVVGIEPAQAIARHACEAGLTTINDFFTDAVAARVSSEYGLASVITANYMYANIDDVLGFTRTVASLLGPEGIFVVQTGYHPDQMKLNMFDYIYHEHFSYFTVEVLQQLFSRCGLDLIHAQRMTPKGGSIRIVGQLKGGSRAVDGSVSALIAEERAAGMRDAETYRTFAAGIDAAKQQLLKVLQDLKASGKRIVGLGASHSTTTLTYHFGLAPFLDYLVDDNPLKHGRFSPGHHQPVYPTTKLIEDCPDYVLILAWQHRQSIMDRHQAYLAQGGHWILPLPQLQVL